MFELLKIISKWYTDPDVKQFWICSNKAIAESATINSGLIEEIEIDLNQLPEFAKILSCMLQDTTVFCTSWINGVASNDYIHVCKI